MVSVVDWQGTSAEGVSRLFDVLGRCGFDCIRIWSATMDSETGARLAAAGYRPASSRPRERSASFYLR
jgi:hypothetical protein